MTPHLKGSDSSYHRVFRFNPSVRTPPSFVYASLPFAPSNLITATPSNSVTAVRPTRAHTLWSTRVCIPLIYPRFASSVCVHPPDRPTTFRSVFACTISPSHRIFTFRSAARPRPSPSVRMTIRLSRSLQLSLRLCAYHLAKSPHLYVPLRSLSAFQSVRAYDHSSKRDSTTLTPCVCEFPRKYSISTFHASIRQ